MQDDEDERLLNRSEVERKFGISKRFLEMAACRGDGPKFIRIGRSVRYRPDDIRAWIDLNSTAGNAQ